MTPSSPPPSLGSKLTRRAIDLLVIGFVAVVGLSVGSQLIDWWRTDPQAALPDLSALGGTDLDWNRTPIAMQFGDAVTSIERIPLQGDYKRLDEELTKIGRSVVTSSQPPVAPPTDAERDWLTALQTAPPLLWESTLGNVYRRQDPLPSFVATRFVEATGSDGEGLTQRVVGWGLAFPSGPGLWTIYSFRPEAVRVAEVSPVGEIVLPDGARRMTQMRGADGCQWLVFQGRGDLAGWVQQFDAVFGTQAVVSKTVGTQSASLKYRTAEMVADVQMRRERDGSLSGVIWSTLKPQEKAK
jgi:hypothetical protein